MELKCRQQYNLAQPQKPFNRTIWNWNNSNPFILVSVFELLIELYGIEITLPVQEIQHKELLIELYGIEIKGLPWRMPARVPFNRTIWNWNRPAHAPPALPDQLLIELYGIEITPPLPSCPALRALLIELYGIEICMVLQRFFCIPFF